MLLGSIWDSTTPLCVHCTFVNNLCFQLNEKIIFLSLTYKISADNKQIFHGKLVNIILPRVNNFDIKKKKNRRAIIYIIILFLYTPEPNKILGEC